jgi:hypothetical protein
LFFLDDVDAVAAVRDVEEDLPVVVVEVEDATSLVDEDFVGDLEVEEVFVDDTTVKLVATVAVNVGVSNFIESRALDVAVSVVVVVVVDFGAIVVVVVVVVLVVKFANDCDDVFDVVLFVSELPSLFVG